MNVKHFAIAAAVLLFLMLGWPAQPLQARELTLGFLPEEPAPAMAELLSQIITEHQISLQPFATASELQQAALNGEVDLAILEEPEKTIPELYWISALYPSVLHMLSKQPLPPAPLIELLNSERVYVGPQGGIADRLARSLRSEYAMQDQHPLLNNPFGSDPQNYFIFGGLLPEDAVSRLSEYQLVGLSPLSQWQRGSVAEAIAFRHPNLYPVLIPADLYPELSSIPVISLGVTTLLVSGSRVSNEIAYDIAAEIDEKFTQITNIYPLAGTLNQEAVSHQMRTLTTHPGTSRYILRDTPNLLERYAEVMALGVTLMLAVVSALLAILRLRRQRRKDRLDDYFMRALAISAQTRAATHPDKLAVFQQKMQALRSEVINLLVNEKIEADNTLLAFLLVTDQLSRETSS